MASNETRWLLARVGLLGLALGCNPKPPVTRTDIARQLNERVGAGTRTDGEVTAGVPEGVVLADGLSEREAVAVALWNHGPLQVALAGLGFARADLVRAGALPNPVFALLFPIGPKQLEANLNWDVSFLWQRGRKVRAASERMEVLAEQLVAHGLDVARDARLAHAEARRAFERHALAVEAADVWQQMAHMTEVQVRVGLASDLDLKTAEVDLHMAQIEAERAARGAEIAVVDLMGVLGLDPHTAAPATTPAPAPARLPPLEPLMKVALAARPEVRAAELRIEAVAAQAGFERIKAYQLTAVLDANGEGKEGFEIGPGMQFPIPIFDHNQGGKVEAEAAVEQAAWNYLAVRQRVTAEVRTAYARFTQARQALDRWPVEVVQPLELSAEGNRKAFAAGGTSYLSVLDSARRLIAAKIQTLELEAEVRRAEIQLARAVGKELDDPS